MADSPRPFTLVETKVRRYTRNDFEPPVLGQLGELAQMTFDADHCEQLARALCGRLVVHSSVDSSSRRVLKALLAIDYILHVGADDFRAQLSSITNTTPNALTALSQSASELPGQSPTREKAKEILHLLGHPEILSWTRRGAAKALGLLLGREFQVGVGKTEQSAAVISTRMDGLSLAEPENRVRRVNNLKATTPSVEDYRATFETLNITDAISLVSERPVKSSFISDVYQGRWARDGEDIKVAVKVVRVTGGLPERALRRHIREISLWHEVAHENILPLCGLYWGPENDSPALVSPWCDNGDINAYLSAVAASGQGDTVLDGLKLKLLEQVLKGLIYLHDYNPTIVHGDIKGANVLVSDTSVARLCDFGLASVVSDSKSLSANTTARGTLRWMAPELFDEDHAQHTTQTDVWAFGCLVLEVQAGSIPYHTLDNESAVIRAIYIDREVTARPAGFPDRLWWLALQTWAVAPLERPTARALDAQMLLLLELQAANPSLWYDPALPTTQQFPPPVAYRTLGTDHGNLKTVQELATLQAMHALLISEDGLAILESQFRYDSDYIAVLNLSAAAASGIRGVPPSISEPFAVTAAKYIHSYIGAPKEQRRHTSTTLELLQMARVPLTQLRALVRLLARDDMVLATWARETFGPPAMPIIKGHTAPINGLQFTPDNKRIISGSDDRTIRVWDLNTGHCVLGPLLGHTERVTCLGVSPDGHYVVSGSDDTTVRLWDAASGATVGEPMRSHKSPLRCVTFASNSRRIASGDETGFICIWEPSGAGNPPTILLEAHTPGPVQALSFATLYGTQVISLSGCVICLRALEAEFSGDVQLALGEREAQLTGSAIGFGSDTMLCALGFRGGDVYVVDVCSGSAETISHLGVVNDESTIALAFIPQRDLAAPARLVAAVDNTVQVWELGSAEGSSLRHQGFIWVCPQNIVVSSDGEVVAVEGDDNSVLFHDLADERKHGYEI